jgi:hypothetical protein
MELMVDEVKNAVTEEEWEEQLGKFERYKGSMAQYCRNHGLNYESFRIRKAERTKINSVAAARMATAFVKVEAPTAVGIVEKKRSCPQPLPDPEWLARFIHTYVNSSR